MAEKWLPIEQYAGFSITDNASKLQTPEGITDLVAGKLVYFFNPNTGTRNFATPETLLKRALKQRKSKKVSSKKADIKFSSKEEKKQAKLAAKQAKIEAKKAKEEAKKAKQEAKEKQKLKKALNQERKLRKSKEKDQLLPDDAAGELRYRFDEQILKDAQDANTELTKKERRFYKGLLGIFVEFNRRDLARVVLYNLEKKVLLLNIQGPQDWREDWWFYNPYTEKYSKFEKSIHQPTPGNEGVIWPDDLGGEHLFGPDYILKNIRSKKRKDYGNEIDLPLITPSKVETEEEE